MSCPTCDHTMQKVAVETHGTWFLCPRCGTMTFTLPGGEHFNTYIPALVQRCRDFADQAVNRKTERIADVWRRTGIADAINKPEGRPQ